MICISAVLQAQGYYSCHSNNYKWNSVGNNEIYAGIAAAAVKDFDYFHVKMMAFDRHPRKSSQENVMQDKPH
jgi:hypothetical protein